jgi:hypothetical protein
MRLAPPQQRCHHWRIYSGRQVHAAAAAAAAADAALLIKSGRGAAGAEEDEGVVLPEGENLLDEAPVVGYDAGHELGQDGGQALGEPFHRCVVEERLVLVQQQRLLGRVGVEPLGPGRH